MKPILLAALTSAALMMIGCGKSDSVKQVEIEDKWTAEFQSNDTANLKLQADTNDKAARYDAACQARTLKVNGSDVKLKLTREANGRVQCDLPADVKQAEQARQASAAGRGR